MLRLIPILAALVLLTGLSGCERSVTWKQKLTLVIETPTGEVSGSSVTQVTITENARFWARVGNAIRTDLQGEAVVVEIAEGRYLFALLGGAENWASPLATEPAGVSDPLPRFRSIAASEEVMLLTEKQIPMLVTFDDINDPASVKLVDPSDLAASFGQGVRLKAVTLEITDEPVTEGKVELVMGWWLSMLPPLLPLRLPNDSPRGWNHLSPSEFWSGDRVLEFLRRVE